MKFFAKLISTVFYVGYLPLIPGTFGSLAGLALYYLVYKNINSYLFLLVFITVLGFIFSGIAEKIFARKDPRYIVIDEVAGMLLSLLFIPYSLKNVIIAFFLFRLMDTVKPYPASGLQRIKGSVGIMADDIVAGFYANIILQAVLKLASFKIS